VEEDWLQHVNLSFSDPSTGILILPVDFHQPNWTKSFFELEFLSLVGSGLASAQGGRALMANGANLAFRRQAFKDVGGYSSHSAYSSGDDQFLLFDIHKSENWEIKTAFSQSLTAHTEAPKNWKTWFSQRIRWGSKATAPSTTFAAGISWLVFLTCLFMTISALASLVWSSLISWTIVAFVLKAIADAAFLASIASRFKKLHLMIVFPLLAIVYPILLTVSALLSLVVRPNWKGKRISVGK
jgi:biofilm PGA synthesis N-glycosyltransferase PgaC